MDIITELKNLQNGDLAKNSSKIISVLQNKNIDVETWDNLIKDYEPTLHEIVFDRVKRKDKIKSDGSKDEASRIYLGLEKLLTQRMTEFMFAIPVKRLYHNIEGNETRKQIAIAIENVYKHARINRINSQRGVNYFGACEFFTIWYAVRKDNTLYGFNSKFKLKCKNYSPMDGAKLYPLFDATGDMIAMSIKYTNKDINGNIVTYFDAYTSDRHIVWKMNGAEWVLETNESIAIMKIPGIYLSRPKPIYHGLSYLRNELEYTLSRNSDVIAYNAAPVLKVVGGVTGAEQKGESRRVYRTELGGDVAYVSWSQSIEAFKYHVETLNRMFWSLSQMPDISFANMMSLGNIGFDARQTLLTDAHLKVGDESGIWVETFEREYNVIAAFLKMMNTEWAEEIDNIDVEHVITPFIQNDEKSEIEKHVNACGGKAIESQIDAIKNVGLSANPEETLKQIQAEEAAAAKMRVGDIFNEGAV